MVEILGDLNLQLLGIKRVILGSTHNRGLITKYLSVAHTGCEIFLLSQREGLRLRAYTIAGPRLILFLLIFSFGFLHLLGKWCSIEPHPQPTAGLGEKISSHHVAGHVLTFSSRLHPSLDKSVNTEV